MFSKITSHRRLEFGVFCGLALAVDFLKSSKLRITQNRRTGSSRIRRLPGLNLMPPGLVFAAQFPARLTAFKIVNRTENRH
jgi:hypothetical protein